MGIILSRFSYRFLVQVLSMNLISIVTLLISFEKQVVPIVKFLGVHQFKYPQTFCVPLRVFLVKSNDRSYNSDSETV